MPMPAWNEYLPEVAALAAFAAGSALADPVVTPPAQAASAAAPIAAVWLEHDASFVYFGQTTYYSCDGLRDKVRYLMKRVGARPADLEVRVSCSAFNGDVESMPRVQVHAAIATVATPERLERLASDPKRQLVAKVRGKGEADAPTAQFAAVREVVEFADPRDERVEAGDCELLEQMVERVFEPMGITVAEGSRLSCMHRQVPMGSVRLRLATLQKAPEPDAAPARKPQ